MSEPDDHAEFYVEILRHVLASGLASRDSRVLVVCGGEIDHQVFLRLGFRDVTISNLDDHLPGGAQVSFAPYAWSRQDVEHLSYPDGAFDLVVVHSGLHHCHSPHRGLLEMYRVARRAALGFEPHDSPFTRLGVRLGVGQRYETIGMHYSDFQGGGVANTIVPNHVYRMDAHEIAKTIRSYAPAVEPRLRFWYRTRTAPDFPGANPVVRGAVRLLRPVLLAAGRRLPALANNIAFLVEKPTLPGDLQPWMQVEGETLRVDKAYLARQRR